MEDHLFESWYKMFVKGDSTGKCEGGNDDNFSGNVKGGKQSWTDRKKGVFGGLHAADEVYEEDSEEVVTMHHKGLASRDGRSNGRVRGSGVLKRGDRKKESSKKRAIN